MRSALAFTFMLGFYGTPAAATETPPQEADTAPPPNEGETPPEAPLQVTMHAVEAVEKQGGLKLNAVVARKSGLPIETDEFSNALVRALGERGLTAVSLEKKQKRRKRRDGLTLKISLESFESERVGPAIYANVRARVSLFLGKRKVKGFLVSRRDARSTVDEARDAAVRRIGPALVDKAVETLNIAFR